MGVSLSAGQIGKAAKNQYPEAMEATEARNTGLPAKIAEQVRRLITLGSLAPGVHLGQTELAERFDASRVPVREALKLLAAEGLVDHDPNRGFFVAKLSSDEARQLYRMRQLVETELLASISWPPPDELEALSADVERMQTLLEDDDRVGWARTHREFHRRIFDLSDQKVLVREVVRLWALTDRYRSLLPPPRSMGEGEVGETKLIDALAKRDRATLIRVFQEDRARVEKMLLAMLKDRHL